MSEFAHGRFVAFEIGGYTGSDVPKGKATITFMFDSDDAAALGLKTLHEYEVIVEEIRKGTAA